MSQPEHCPRCGAPLARTPTGEPLDGLCPACLLRDAADTPPPTPGDVDLDEVRSRFPELEIDGVLGQGGMGVVYRARQLRLDRPVALKVLHPECADDPAFAERFLREARAMAKLNHPNIVQVYDFGEQDGRFYLVMELVDGVRLRSLLDEGALEPAQALGIVPAICDGLQYAHENGVVHRDIKPENVLLDRTGRVKIADFGLAKLVQLDPGGIRTRASQIMGTPHYMAPEQVNDPLAVDHRADIYSLGVVFYELLTGELPVGAFAPPSRLVSTDARLDEVVKRALERQPERRYQAAEEVRTDVDRISAEDSRGDRAAAKAAEGDAFAEYWSLPASPRNVGIACLVASWVWGTVLVADYVGTDLSVAYWSRDLARWAEAMAMVYPLAFLAWRCGFVGGMGSLGVLALPTCAVAVFVASSQLTFPNLADAGLELIAGVAAVSAHLYFDRWVRSGPGELLLFAVALLIGGGVCHACWSHGSPIRDTFYFATGIGALAAISSTLAVVPFGPELERRGRLLQPLLRSFPVALVLALAYFIR